MQIDLHADTPLWMHWLGYQFLKRHRAWLPGGAFLSHLDLPRIVEANLDAQVFGLVTAPWEPESIHTIHSLIDSVEAAAFHSDGRFRIVTSTAELRGARQADARACFLSVEGVHSLGGRMERVDPLLDRGVISIGLAHFTANEACCPAAGFGRQDDQGLTPFGRDLVDHLRARRVLIDLAHINRRGFFDVTRRANGAGIFVSHTGVNGAHLHWRNIDDDQIRAVAEAGGVVGVIFSRGFLGGAGLDAVARHIKHIIKVGGKQTPALGSDFDGLVVPPRGLRDITGLPGLRDALGAAGLPPSVLDGVMGDNALRMIEETVG